jgi:diguanylate cyclase (GGDEF)-like protein/PAS domain S-box-containing protein
VFVIYGAKVCFKLCFLEQKVLSGIFVMALRFGTYAQFLETIPDAAMVINRVGVIMLANSQTEIMFGYHATALKNRSVQSLLPEKKRMVHAKHIQEYFVNPKTRPMGKNLEFIAQRNDGSEFFVEIMLKPIKINETLYVLCIVRDITERAQAEAALKKELKQEEELAHTDYLTGAANLRLFHTLVQQEILSFQRRKHPFSIAYIDLDNFKVCNDRFGHDQGDKILRAVVQCARNKLRKTDCVARLGGDEFAFLLRETGTEAAQIVVSKIHNGLMIEMQKNDWPITFSVGVVTCIDKVPQLSDELIKAADKLMYSVKNKGKNAVIYSTYEG